MECDSFWLDPINSVIERHMIEAAQHEFGDAI